jgi:ABC-type uncharacterized transport system permease subunit
MISAAFLLGALSAGAIEIDLFTRVPRDIIMIVQAVMLLFVLASERIARGWRGLEKRRA